MNKDMQRKLIAEWLGTFSLLATVIGSGIMAERLAGGNIAIALLGNTIPTGAILVVLILVFGPVSGAHFNPAVTLTFAIRREISTKTSFANPAVTVARGFSNTFAGIQPIDITAFIGVQLLAACLATFFFKWLLKD